MSRLPDPSNRDQLNLEHLNLEHLKKQAKDLIRGYRSRDPEAIADEGTRRQATKADPAWIDRPGGPLKLPPLLAVTHSSLLQVPEFRERLHGSARFLLAAGANPDQRIGSRWPPASVRAPDDAFPLSALYGAAGKNHDSELTKLLLDAG